MRLQVNLSLEKKDGVLGASKLFQIDLAFLDVRLVIGVSITIHIFSLLCIFYCFCFDIVTELNVSEFNQMYEILG